MPGFVIICRIISKSHGIKTRFRLHHISHRAPQGSILGPLLFVVYMNDNSQVILDLELARYADDTAIYVSGNSVAEVQNKLQSDLDNIELWLRANKLTLNVKKTKCMLITQYFKGDTDFSLVMQNEALEQVSVFKYLGGLNW